MKLIINITADPSELMAISRELAGNMNAKINVDALSSAVAKELGTTLKRTVGRPKKAEAKNDMDKEIEAKIFG